MTRAKGIADNKAVEPSPILQVFGQQRRAARPTSGLYQQRIPERDLVKAMDVNRPQHVVDGDQRDLKLCEEFDLSARRGGGDLQLLRRCREVLFKRLGGYERVPMSLARFDQRERDGLLLGRVVIVGVDEDVRVEEAN